jgi:hypothetical protein
MKYCARTRAATDLPTPPFSPPMKLMELMDVPWEEGGERRGNGGRRRSRAPMRARSGLDGAF